MTLDADAEKELLAYLGGEGIQYGQFACLAGAGVRITPLRLGQPDHVRLVPHKKGVNRVYCDANTQNEQSGAGRVNRLVHQ